MTSPSLGPVLVAAGVVIVIVGALIWAGGTSWLGWFGRLPGDIRIERDTVRVYIPLMSMLLVSVVLSLIMYLLRRLL
jgi:membrane protein DedA with SNARE-associated domain